MPSRLNAILAACFVLSARLTAQTTAVTGGTLIDGTGRAPIADAVVVMQNGKITAIGAAKDVTVPAGATKVDARGKYIIPGLMDANLHLDLNITLEELIRYEDHYDKIVLEGAQIALKTGQTTVFDTWGPRAALIKVRDQINRGEAVGSRIYLAGNIIGFSGPLGPDFVAPAAAYVSKAFAKRTNDTWEQGTGRELLWMPPDSLRKAIHTYTTLGVDFLKFGGSGHQEMNLLTFSPRAEQVIVDEGHRAGLTVQAHVTSPESIDMAVDAGVDILTHGDISGPVFPIPPETIKKIVDKGVAISVLSLTKRAIDAQSKQSKDNLLLPYMKVAAENIKNLTKAGARLLVSTDAGVEDPVRLSESPTLAADTVDARTTLGEGHFNGLMAFEEAGMAPMEILKTATSNVAKAYKVDKDFGTLEVGKAADLVILDANPLESARNYRRISAVIKSGKTVDLAALPAAPVISSKRVPKA
jgi:imidazolonepropionase-like amidohydrolase